MNGVLWKWTNYYSGWQPRWFILKDGILSYYRSEEEVQSGSKGSINLSICDLNVSSFDNTRFEIVIPGEQKYHLKASNIQERQRWIVAIGSCKACYIEPDCEIKANGSITMQVSEISWKESEMRIYMELINQQVVLIKSQLHENECPDISSINDLTATLNAASDTFLASLKDLMSIIALNSFLVLDSPPIHAGPPPFSSLNLNIDGDHKITKKTMSLHSGSRSFHENGLHDSRTRKSISQESRVLTDSMVIDNRRSTNFFIQMTHSYVDWSKMVGSTCSVATEPYINSFWSLLHFLDNFDITPIVSLKSDIIVSVKRLSQKFEANREKFGTLEGIVKSESGHLHQLNVESATYVIRSLNRSLMFVEYLLQYMHSWLASGDYGDVDVLKGLLTRAYDNTLKAKMNWLDQGLFTIITKSLPPLSELLCHLLCRYTDVDEPVDVLVRSCSADIEQLLVDMNTYRNSVTTVNVFVTKFLTEMQVEL